MLICFLLIDKVTLYNFLIGDIFLIKYFFDELSIRIILRFFSFFAFVIKIFSDLDETFKYSFCLLLLYFDLPDLQYHQLQGDLYVLLIIF